MIKGSAFAVAGLTVLLLAGTLCISWSLNRAATSYRRGEYPAAAAAWGRLAHFSPGSPEIAFNRGVSLYRQREYRAAAAELSKAIRGKDYGVRSAAHYNLGNTLVRLGDDLAPTDRSGAADLYRQAAEQYEETLRLVGADGDARHNLAVTRSRLQAMRTAPHGQSGAKTASGNREEGRSRKRESEGKSGSEKHAASEARRAATGDQARSRSSKKVAGDGKNSTGSSQPLSMTRQDAEALLREHASTAGPTAIFRDGGQPGQAAPALKEW